VSADRLGITTPIVTLNPKGHGAWEERATPDDLAAIARCVDDLGYHHLTCSEHVAVPVAAAATRGATYWDPLSTLSWLAAHTTRIGLATHVVVTGYHHPLEIVKRYGTLDRLSGGRVTLGVGVGSLAEEFGLLGAEFAGRGDAADRWIDEVRAAWGHDEVDGFVISPTSDRTDVDVWVGGRTRRSLRRAVEHGTGWAPFGMSPDQLGAALADVDLPDGFEVVGWAYGLDPMGAPAEATDRVHAMFGLGSTLVNVRFTSRSAVQWCEQAAAMADLVSAGRPARPATG